MVVAVGDDGARSLREGGSGRRRTAQRHLASALHEETLQPTKDGPDAHGRQEKHLLIVIISANPALDHVLPGNESLLSTDQDNVDAWDDVFLLQFLEAAEQIGVMLETVAAIGGEGMTRLGGLIATQVAWNCDIRISVTGPSR